MAIDWGILNTHAATDIADAYKQGQQKAAQKGVLAMYGTDPEGAQKAALQTGDLSTVQAVNAPRSNDAQIGAQKLAAQNSAHDRAIQQAQQKLQATAQFANALTNIQVKAPDGSVDEAASAAQRKAYALSHADTLAAWDVTPQQLESFDYSTNGLHTYTNQALTLHDQVEQHKPLDLGPGHRAFDPQTGQLIASTPQELKGFAIPQGGSLGLLGGDGSVSMTAGAGVAPGAAAVSGPTGAASDTARGVRNNNPGNVTLLPDGQKWAGQTGSDGKFAVFATPAAGQAAAEKNLIAKQTRHGLNTVNSIIGDPTWGWAPARDGNDPVAYAASVAKDLGVGPDDPIDVVHNPALRSKMLESMYKTELGGSRPVSAQAGVQSQNGVRIIQGNPKPGKTAPMPFSADPERAKRFGIDEGVAGYFDAEGEPHILKDATQGDASIPYTPATFTRLAGEAMANGGQFPAGSFPIGKGGNGIRAAAQNRLTEMAMINGVDGFGLAASKVTRHADAVSLNKLTALRDYVKTKEDTTTRSMDLAVQAAAQGGGGTNFPALNKLVIDGKRMTGNTYADKYVNQLGAAVDEYSNVIGGGGGNAPATDSARAEARRRISEAASLPQLKAVLEGMKQDMAVREEELSKGVDTVRGRLGVQPGQSPAQRGQRSSGANPSRMSGMSAAQRRTVQQFKGSTAPAGDKNSPWVPTTQDEFEKIAPGQWFINPADGRVLRKTH